jgi:hypothetical protein
MSARAASIILLVVALTAGCIENGDVELVSTDSPSDPSAVHPSFLYGRITTVDGETYQGRIRFGGDQEAFWGDYFNGYKDGNPWVDLVPEGQLGARPLIEVLGLEIGNRGPGNELNRQIMARFGDIAAIEADGRDLWVWLKSGAEFHLSRYAADDFADGLRVWDQTGSVLDIDEGRVRRIEFLAPPQADAAPPRRLHGTVRTRQGDFTGFVEWNRRGSLGSDEISGLTADGGVASFPFDSIRAIERASPESGRLTLLDGREVVLSDARDVGRGGGGIYVDDPRYGRVLVSWDAFDRIDFTLPSDGPDGSGPGYADFPEGGPLVGTVTTRAGRTFTGQLVYDLDESQITETLDAPSGGVDYTIPFGLVASVVLPADAGPAVVSLRSGEELRLERAGDLGAGNAGVLVFLEGERREYVPWSEVVRVDF